MIEEAYELERISRISYRFFHLQRWDLLRMKTTIGSFYRIRNHFTPRMVPTIAAFNSLNRTSFFTPQHFLPYIQRKEIIDISIRSLEFLLSISTFYVNMISNLSGYATGSIR